MSCTWCEVNFVLVARNKSSLSTLDIRASSKISGSSMGKHGYNESGASRQASLRLNALMDNWSVRPAR